MVGLQHSVTTGVSESISGTDPCRVHYNRQLFLCHKSSWPDQPNQGSLHWAK